MESYEKLCISFLLFFLGPYQTMEMLQGYFTASEYLLITLPMFNHCYFLVSLPQKVGSSEAKCSSRSGLAETLKIKTLSTNFLQEIEFRVQFSTIQCTW